MTPRCMTSPLFRVAPLYGCFKKLAIDRYSLYSLDPAPRNSLQLSFRGNPFVQVNRIFSDCWLRQVPLYRIAAPREGDTHSCLRLWTLLKMALRCTKRFRENKACQLEYTILLSVCGIPKYVLYTWNAQYDYMMCKCAGCKTVVTVL